MHAERNPSNNSFLISNFQMFQCLHMCRCSFFCVKICCVLEESSIHLSIVVLHTLTGTPFLPDSKDGSIPDWRKECPLAPTKQRFCGCSTVRFSSSWPFTVEGRRTFPHYHVEYAYSFQCATDTNQLSCPFGFDSAHPLFKTRTHLR